MRVAINKNYTQAHHNSSPDWKSIYKDVLEHFGLNKNPAQTVNSIVDVLRSSCISTCHSNKICFAGDKSPDDILSCNINLAIKIMKNFKIKNWDSRRMVQFIQRNKTLRIKLQRRMIFYSSVLRMENSSSSLFLDSK